jgi:hypothetical protein
MDDLLAALLGLGCFLSVVALVGHALWLAAVKIYAVVTGDFAEQPAGVLTANTRGASECPRCQTWIKDRKSGCPVCGWPQNIAKSKSSQRALAALERQLEQYHLAGVFDSFTYLRLAQAVRDEVAQCSEAMAALEPAIDSAPALVAEVAASPSPASPAAELVIAEMVAEPAADIPSGAAPIELWSAEAATPAARVEEFIRRRSEADAVLPRDPQPASPTRLAQLLSAFLEEKHIRWGELVGGLLIVCCSIALVLSFWSRIAEMPVLKFLVFNGVTASLFGLGFYSRQRWKLPTTSHGLFVIATLLVPLNFLAIAAFTRQADAITTLTIVGEVLSIALFGFLVYRSGGSIVGEPAALVIGVLGPSIGQLLVRRFIQPDMSALELAGLAAVPAACYLISTGWSLVRTRRGEMTASSAHAMFTFLGIVSLATALPLGLLLARSEHAALALHRLAPLAALLGAPYLACGLLMWRRAASDALVQTRTAGTAMAVFGSLVMLCGIALAWPSAGGMLLSAAACAILFTLVAARDRIPAVYGPGLACATLAWLLAAALLRGDIAWQLDDSAALVKALFSAASGMWLVPWSALVAMASWQLRRRGRFVESLVFYGAALGIAALSLVVVSWHGLGRVTAGGQATWLVAGYAIAATVVAFAARRRGLAFAGAALILIALVQGLAYDYAGALEMPHPWTTALLLHATALGLLAMLTNAARGSDRRQAVCAVWAGWAAATSLLSSMAITSLLPWADASWLAIHFVWLAGIWLALGWHCRSSIFLAGVQLATGLAVALAVASRLELQSWFMESRLHWLDPWSIQSLAISLTLWALAWSVLRAVACRTRAPARRLLAFPADQLDRAALILLLVTATGLALYAALPGAAQELTPRRLAMQLVAASGNAPADGAARVVPPLAAFEVPGIAHRHAMQWGTWLLMGGLASVLVVRQWERFNPWRVLGLLLLASLACPLLAARFESEVATASALRWLTAIFLALASAAIWLRQPLLRAARRLGWPDTAAGLPPLRRDAVVLSLLLAGLPLIAMGAYTALIAVWNTPIEPSVRSAWNSLAVLFATVGLAGLLLSVAGRHMAMRPPEFKQSWLSHVGLLLLILAAAPVIVVSLYVVSAALKGNPIAGPDPASFFARIGLAASYALPILLIAVTLVGHAIRERSSAFAFAAGLLLNTSATAGWLLVPRPAGLQFDALLWVKLAQLNLLVTAAYAMIWLAATSRRLRRITAATADPLLATQIALAIVLDALLLIPACLVLWLNPSPMPWQVQLGQPLGWCAVATSLIALAWHQLRMRNRLNATDFELTLLAVGTTLCFWLARWDSGNWLCWHSVLLWLVIAAWAPWIVAAWLRFQRAFEASSNAAVLGWSLFLATTVVVWSVRSGWSDPERPWWSLAALGMMTLLLSVVACWRGERRYLGVASLLVNLAATIGWLNLATLPRQFSGMLMELAAVQAIALTLPAVLWLLLDLRVLRQHAAEPRPRKIGMHAVAAALGVFIITGLVALGIWADFSRESIDVRPWLEWLALASVGSAVAACLWDERVKSAVAGMYVLGLAAVGMTLDQFNLAPHWLVWTGTMLTAAYTLATSYLWSRRDGLSVWCDALGIPRDSSAPLAGQRWLLAANSLLIASVMALAVWIDLTFVEQPLRLFIGKAAIVQALAIGLLARGQRQSMLQSAALSVGVLGAVIWGWAWLAPDMEAGVLHRLVVVGVTLAAMSVLYGLGLVKLLKRENEWTRAAGRLVPSLVSLCGAALVLVLAGEVVLHIRSGAAPMLWPAIVAVATALLTIAAAALAAAVLPGRDPLGLSPRGRTVYVYAAEGVLALLFVHIRLTMPWLFSGFFERYWPFVVMLIAFVGVGLSEWLRRRRQDVLAEPLENTAALLPLLPVVGFWATSVEVHYSMLLVAVGAMYATLSTLKRSFGFGLLSALALNGALWYLLYDIDGLGLTEHPQLWLIPPALCVLAAAYLNRDRLSDSQMTSLRYGCSTMIYVSSTADIFLTGVAHAPWLPLVLAGLSVAGIFLGILLRVRGFLLLGASFLMLALATMIWHAAWNLDHTWVWSASGIVAGMLIIALFAVFEKKRQEVLRLVDQLKEWEA